MSVASSVPGMAVAETGGKRNTRTPFTPSIKNQTTDTPSPPRLFTRPRKHENMWARC